MLDFSTKHAVSGAFLVLAVISACLGDTMGVGQGAGWQEEHRRTPWCGKAGQLLRAELGKITSVLGRIGVAFGNTVRCRPIERDPDNPGLLRDRVPTDVEVGHCAQYLLKDIVTLNPRIVIGAGAHAAQFFGFSGPVGQNRGKFKMFIYDLDGARKSFSVTCTYHPAGVLRNKEYLTDMVRDLETCYKIIKTPKEEELQLRMDL